jgi:hypothetical protein
MARPQALTIAALLALMAASGRAFGAGTSAADFLSIPTGGRPAGLAGAYTALAADAYAPVWNAAGLAGLPSAQVSAMHLEYASAIGYEFASGVLPLGASDGVGAAAQYLHPKAATARDAAGAEIGGFTSYYAAYSLAYGRAVTPSFSLGAAAKLIDARIADVSGRAVAADLGALYRAGPRLRVGASIANLGSRLKFLDEGESLPDAYRLGLAFTPAASWTLAAEGAYDRADAAYGHWGAEWRPVPLLAVRAGYHSDGAGEQGAVSGRTRAWGSPLWASASTTPGRRWAAWATRTISRPC